MSKLNKLKLRRFIGFSVCNAPGTILEILIIWLMSDVLFHSHFARFIIAPVIAFECSMLVDFALMARFVWRDSVVDDTGKRFLHRLLMFNISTVGVYLMRLLLIQLLHWAFGLGPVVCDLLSMVFSGLLNFGINDRLIFAQGDDHRLGVRLLMGLVRPFVTLKIEGLENLPKQDEDPVVYICNHGFFFGPVAAVLNLPGSFRPWIDSKALDVKECFEAVNRIVGRRFRLFGLKIRHKISNRITRCAVGVLNDFNPIPVFKSGSRKVIETIQQSVDALVSGENLLIFPERPRKSNNNIRTERMEAANLRAFYSGFAKIGQDFFDRTGRALNFVPVYINQKQHTMCIAPAVAYSTTDDRRADSTGLATQLYNALFSMSNK